MQPFTVLVAALQDTAALTVKIILGVFTDLLKAAHERSEEGLQAAMQVSAQVRWCKNSRNATELTHTQPLLWLQDQVKGDLDPDSKIMSSVVQHHNVAIMHQVCVVGGAAIIPFAG